MRRTVAQVICDGCGEKIEEACRGGDSAIVRAGEEAEARRWWRDGRRDYCGGCKAAAKLASEALADGEEAFEAGGRAWAGWNTAAMDLED